MTTEHTAELRKIIEDLTGQKIPFGHEIPRPAVKLFSARNSKGVGYSQFNELLLYLGYDRVTHPFFQFLVNQKTEYKTGAALKTIDAFRHGVDEFRKVAILFFGNVKFAFKTLSRDASFLEEHLARFAQRRESSFKARHEQVLPPEEISGKDTYYLGYVVKKHIQQKLRDNPQDAEALAQEQKREEIVERAKRNHASYLVSDHLDVYIATSMRERHEFEFVYKAKDTASRKRAILNQLKVYRPSSAWDDAEVRSWLSDPDKMTYAAGIKKLQVAMVDHFKSRDGLLRDTHPLGIQMNLQTGVANGVPVVNTVDQCARLVRCLLLRQLAFKIDAQEKSEGEYLLLRETISDSIFRVVSGDPFLTNAFWNFYLNPSECVPELVGKNDADYKKARNDPYDLNRSRATAARRDT